MKKILILGLMLSVFLMPAILAVDQGINATIGDDITIVITPTTVTFGAIMPGTANNPSTSGNVGFDPSGSNVHVNVEVTTVTGEPFHSGLKFDGILAEGKDYDIPCALVLDVCTYTLKVVVPTLDVPTGSPAGVKTGIITYTITGTTP